jgi:hypothetical protein
LVGAREGAALPLNDFEVYYFDFDFDLDFKLTRIVGNYATDI